MNLLQLLLGSLTTESTVNSLVKKTGISSKLLQKLIVVAIPILIRYMTKNASSQTGAQSLLSALTQHKGTKSMSAQIDEVDEEDGSKIIGHILGNDKDKVFATLAKETGLETNDVSKGLGALAPALLTGLSAATTQASSNNAMDLGDLFNMFGGNQTQATNSLGLLGSLLGSSQPQQQQNNIGGLFSGLLGSSQPQPQQQSSSGLLGSLFGGNQQQVQQPTSTGLTDLFGSLMGSGATQQQQQAQFDGSDLLNALTSLMQNQ